MQSSWSNAARSRFPVGVFAIGIVLIAQTVSSQKAYRGTEGTSGASALPAFPSPPVAPTSMTVCDAYRATLKAYHERAVAAQKACGDQRKAAIDAGFERCGMDAGCRNRLVDSVRGCVPTNGWCSRPYSCSSPGSPPGTNLSPYQACLAPADAVHCADIARSNAHKCDEAVRSHQASQGTTTGPHATTDASRAAPAAETPAERQARQASEAFAAIQARNASQLETSLQAQRTLRAASDEAHAIALAGADARIAHLRDIQASQGPARLYAEAPGGGSTRDVTAVALVDPFADSPPKPEPGGLVSAIEAIQIYKEITESVAALTGREPAIEIPVPDGVLSALKHGLEAADELELTGAVLEAVGTLTLREPARSVAPGALFTATAAGREAMDRFDKIVAAWNQPEPDLDAIDRLSDPSSLGRWIATEMCQWCARAVAIHDWAILKHRDFLYRLSATQ